jgi:uncharacterized protein YacL
MLFRKPKVFVLDLETVADPRIVQFLEFGIVSGKLLLPEPPKSDPSPEEGHLADRAREHIDRLRHVKGLSIKLDSKLLGRDALIEALRKNKATLITVNEDLRSACDGMAVVSAREVYNLFKPQHLPGNTLRVRIAKRGKEKNEGIGYLENGVKVVVENGADAIGQEMEVVVQGGLETGVGQVVFAKPRFSEVN